MLNIEKCFGQKYKGKKTFTSRNFPLFQFGGRGKRRKRGREIADSESKTNLSPLPASIPVQQQDSESKGLPAASKLVEYNKLSTKFLPNVSR